MVLVTEGSSSGESNSPAADSTLRFCSSRQILCCVAVWLLSVFHPFSLLSLADCLQIGVCDYLNSECVLFVGGLVEERGSFSMILRLFIAAAKKGKPTLILHYPPLCPHSVSPVNKFPTSRCSQMRRLSQKTEGEQGRERKRRE